MTSQTLESPEKTIRNSIVLVNFAAETHADRSIAGPKPFFRSNANRIFNVLEASKEYRVRKLVHISTDEVYGSIESGSHGEESSLVEIPSSILNFDTRQHDDPESCGGLPKHAVAHRLKTSNSLSV